MRFLFIIWASLYSAVAHAAEVSLIIDDMGNNKRDAQAFALPPEVAFAILPNKPLSTPFSERAAAQHRDVILHMPMESLSRKKQEQGVLLSTMPSDEIIETLRSALSTVPHAVGVNNHMGSRLTQLTRPMSVTMKYLHQRGLYFVDSRTTRYSKAESIADKVGVMNTKRNVFLDHVVTPAAIDQQFQRLINVSKKYGMAVGIGHPHPQTLDYLVKNLAKLEGQGVSLVKLSDVLNTTPDLVATTNPTTSKPTLKE